MQPENPQEARSAACPHVSHGWFTLCEVERKKRKCVHEWEYAAEESKGPWTGYIERCKLCGALQQVPQ